MNMMEETKKRQAEKRAELISTGYVFEPVINDKINEMSIDELDDLMALQIGDETYIIDIGDVRRVG
jgi:hypothetical protein